MRDSDMAYTTTTHEIASRFMQLLQQAEETGNLDSLVALFCDDAELINLAMPEPLRGQAGAYQFWDKYLSVFNRIHSKFTNVIESDDVIVLEWISTGVLSSAKEITYRGVSLLEINNGQVHRFRTYYDSAAFLPQEIKGNRRNS
jgi:ketosteroid isomerase-like protein